MSRTRPHLRTNHRAQSLARGLGWVSIALGLGELLAPGALKRGTGAPGPATLLQAYGLREIATGALILASDRPVSMVWARVAGDVLDLATLAPAASPDNPQREGGIGALAFVAAVTAVDIAVALQGDEEAERR
ncbi:hypothetical protein [Aureimonas jatrophae]|uniref:Uncharacterized protein n=1 Tax=Aureimonas jatrophae TaxID=1166073 RepID=A0A1H0DK53_9HYPH|nr:hypothetical protein [Aureimonas jatrophae]MBB3951933.1 hypothetical protein [Aureimonas jatrophae]SDN70381.1 hypothetical protein SAMN05192530_101822 [Aureimonas jatrophae]